MSFNTLFPFFFVKSEMIYYATCSGREVTWSERKEKKERKICSACNAQWLCSDKIEFRRRDTHPALLCVFKFVYSGGLNLVIYNINNIIKFLYGWYLLIYSYIIQNSIAKYIMCREFQSAVFKSFEKRSEISQIEGWSSNLQNNVDFFQSHEDDYFLLQ